MFTSDSEERRSSTTFQLKKKKSLGAEAKYNGMVGLVFDTCVLNPESVTSNSQTFFRSLLVSCEMTFSPLSELPILFLLLFLVKLLEIIS